VDEPRHARLARQACEIAGGRDMDALKGPVALLDIQAHRIDGAVGAFERGHGGGCVLDVGLQHHEPRPAGAEKGRHPLGMARGGAHGKAVLQQALDNAAAEKAGAAEDGDGLVGPVRPVHGASLGAAAIEVDAIVMPGKVLCRPPSA
jgi:hypothetical protein